MPEISVKIMECALVESGVMKINRIGVGIGVILYNAAQKKAAGIHILAPNTTEAAPANPAKYVNTAIPFALNELEKKGVKAPFKVAVAGGAEMQNMPPQVRMGQKMVAALTDALGKANLIPRDKQTGGANIRTMECDLSTGNITIS
jgi:chemotaxis receptor (MCP) glutamine deamidase CheD